MPGPRPISRAPAGSASTRRQACWPGKGTCPSPRRPHYRSAAPITGAVEFAQVDFSFEMRVTRIAERPRVTYPFSDDAWAALDALGEQVDAALAAQDVRLTMGGEPTFVSIDDYQSAEWNIDALGPTKRMRADDLVRRLARPFRPERLPALQPGQMVSRRAAAALGLCAVLAPGRSADLARPIADSARRPRPRPDHRPGCSASPKAWRRASASRPITLCRPMRTRCGACIQESDVPANIDPADPRIDDPAERQHGSDQPENRRSGRARPTLGAFTRPLSQPTGFVLPVQPANAPATRKRWYSELWRLRRRHLFLIPGNSPLGFRLPLESLPQLPAWVQPLFVPADPFAPHDELPQPSVLFQQRPRAPCAGDLRNWPAGERGGDCRTSYGTA